MPYCLVSEYICHVANKSLKLSIPGVRICRTSVSSFLPPCLFPSPHTWQSSMALNGSVAVELVSPHPSLLTFEAVDLFSATGSRDSNATWKIEIGAAVDGSLGESIEIERGKGRQSSLFDCLGCISCFQSPFWDYHTSDTTWKQKQWL